jgi:hypothetical protein
VLFSACVTVAGEYVVREMGTPDVRTVVGNLNRAWSSTAPALGTLAATLNRAWSSVASAGDEQTAPVVEPKLLVPDPLPSAATVAALQPSLPSAQRLLDLAPGDDQFRADSRRKEGRAVTATKGVTNSPRAVATVGNERRSSRRADLLAVRETPPATPIARSAPPATHQDEGILQAGAQEQRREIEDVLRRYELAYRRLDAGGAKAVWPTLDERTLARSFDGLSWQEVRFDRCVIHLSSPDAEAVCAGITTYLPKADNPQPRSERRRWTFQLRRAEGAWTIVRADAKHDDRP